MTNFFSQFTRTRVGTKFVLISVTISTAVAIVATLAQVVWDFRVEKNWAEERLRQIESQHAPVLAETLWIMDEKLMDVQLSSIRSMPDVAAVTLTRPDQEKIQLGIPPSDSAFSPVVHRTDLTYRYGNQLIKLGSLEVFVSLDRAVATIAERFVLELGTNFFKTLLVVLLLLIVFHKLIGQHLHTIVRELEHEDPTKDRQPLSLKRKAGAEKDELDLLVDAYNSANLALRNALSDLQASNGALLVAKEKAEEMNKAKSIFLGNISHELRTPLAAIHGYVDMLNRLEETEVDRREKIYSRLSYNSTTLLSLVNELLDMSKFEAGKVLPTFEEFELRPLIRDIIAGFTELGAKKNVEVNLRISDDVPVMVRLDVSMFTKIIRNLVGNALKFTSAGSVSVEFVLEAGSRLVILVKDTGKGIAESARQKIFSPFVQQDEAIARDYGGTGLGLAIVKKSVEALGGNVVLSASEVDRGSVFRVEIPIVQTSADDAALEKDPL